MWRDLGMKLLLFSSHFFTSFILLHKFALILPGTHSSPHVEKKDDKVYIFS